MEKEEFLKETKLKLQSDKTIGTEKHQSVWFNGLQDWFNGLRDIIKHSPQFLSLWARNYFKYEIDKTEYKAELSPDVEGNYKTEAKLSPDVEGNYKKEAKLSPDIRKNVAAPSPGFGTGSQWAMWILATCSVSAACAAVAYIPDAEIMLPILDVNVSCMSVALTAAVLCAAGAAFLWYYCDSNTPGHSQTEVYIEQLSQRKI